MMTWLWFLLPDSATALVVVGIALALMVGLIRPRTASAWLLILVISLVTGPIVEALTDQIIDALPIWLLALVVLALAWAAIRAVLTFVLGPHAAGHVIGTMFVGLVKLLWSVVALPFRALAWLCRRRRLAAFVAICCILAAKSTFAASPVARGAASALERRMFGRGLAGARAFDLARDARTPLRRLPRTRVVQRFASAGKAALEKRAGIAAGTHFTANAAKGLPLSGSSAARRFGLLNPPRVRETVVLPKGFPVRPNKVVGGAGGYGELKSGERLPSRAIQGNVHLPPGR